MSDTQPTNEKEKTDVVVAQPAADIVSVIEKAISSPDVDPEKLHGILDFQERIMARQAEIDFNEAMHRLQLEMPTIKKDGSVEYPIDKNNPDGPKKKAFDFASFENIMRSIKPALQAENFTISFDTEQREGGGAVITATLSHRSGHSKTASFAAALDTSGGKNNIQAMGSTFSYGKRYCVTALLNIITEGEDDDGQSFDKAPIDDAQFNEVQRLLDKTETDTASFCKYLKINSVKEMTSKVYPKAIHDLKAKMKKMGIEDDIS